MTLIKLLDSMLFFRAIIVFVYALFISSPAHAKDGELLEKVYNLDTIMSTGECPSELKKVQKTRSQDFRCDRVRLEFGYRSKELVQCNSRKNLANRIIGEYNLFIDECKNKE